MLKSIRLSHFKAFRQVELELANLTIFIGPNGSGKSSILQALNLLKQSLGEQALNANSEAANLGSFEDVVHRSGERSDRETVGFRVEGIDDRVRDVEGAVFFDYDVAFGEGARVQQQVGRIVTSGVNGLNVFATWNQDGTRNMLDPDRMRVGDHTMIFGPSGTIGRVVSIAGWQGNPDQWTRQRYERIIAVPYSSLHHFYVVPAVRGVELPSYELGSAAMTDLFGQKTADRDAARILTTIAYRRELEEEISAFSKQVLGVALRVNLIPDKRVSAESINGSRLNLVNEGFGANQLMVLLTQLVVAPHGSTVGVEEAEIHLHPRAQGDIAHVFHQLMDQHSKQIIMTTHSEHVLMGFLTKVADGSLPPDKLAVYYFEKRHGVAHAERLEVDSRGRLKGGMKGFFSASVTQLQEYLRSAAPKK